VLLKFSEFIAACRDVVRPRTGVTLTYLSPRCRSYLILHISTESSTKTIILALTLFDVHPLSRIKVTNNVTRSAVDDQSGRMALPPQERKIDDLRCRYAIGQCVIRSLYKIKISKQKTARKNGRLLYPVRGYWDAHWGKTWINYYYNIILTLHGYYSSRRSLAPILSCTSEHGPRAQTWTGKLTVVRMVVADFYRRMTYRPEYNNMGRERNVAWKGIAGLSSLSAEHSICRPEYCIMYYCK